MYKLLIAEDVKTVRETLARSVPWEELGIRLVGTAANGREALARMDEEEPDLLLTDIGMPVMDGLELIEIAQTRQPELRSIILSGLSEFDHARQALKLRVFDYVLKPIDPAEIARVSARAVDQLRQDREARRDAANAGLASREALPHLSELLAPSDFAGDLKKKKLVEQAIAFVNGEYGRRELALSDVAAAVGLSEKYLNTLVKEVTGQTINHWIIRLRMEEAARMLKDPANRIYEICDRIGYADQDHFRESFKKQYGLTPTEYRNRLI